MLRAEKELCAITTGVFYRSINEHFVPQVVMDVEHSFETFKKNNVMDTKTKTKNMLHHLAEHAENGQQQAKSLFSRENLARLKQPRVLWTAAGVTALIGAGVAWRMMRKTKA
ncbi:MAG TPA: hypothetical protein VIN07_01630 [Flavipsychrobacter sp.]